MRILVFDQASNITGYAIKEDDVIRKSGIINLEKVKPSSERIKQMFFAICKIMDEEQFDVVFFEGVEGVRNIETMLLLSCLQGMCIGHAYDKGYDVGVIEVSKWRKELGFLIGGAKKREELKRLAVQYVSDTYEMVCGEDESEAICIATAICLIHNKI